MNNHAIVEFSQITPNIFLGTNLCCAVHADKLKAIHISIDIDLEVERPEEPPEVESYIWLPVIDGHAPSLYQLSIGVTAIENTIKQGKCLYVHCKNGHGRSPTLVIAYLISTGMTQETAYQLVKSKRPEIHLHDVQVEMLMKFTLMRNE
ncbi:hypothetical protein COY90_00665 [Candidatus Roizmanbacteria bacterium CG_4_10_14_0_8_um_filter_39_9]|uniref:Uncharacterized protein n=1 Tax=Candidatus Roizmanbacteria bacterium CG_4_10_14_0_8_um_filter_39_9 TaxID=1974829 RepID=A0A2M7QFA8_9BACT|nr:MAG: hypothetical protein COY90_00665 [Candidatus Roizmanbacteria bacterium CG_4_10_14_0_8_um_filter_39_9]